jgi:NAD(P)H-quinone oxidoreductase subunit 5
MLCGSIGAFAYRYMHREPGYNRFFVLYSIFLMGMIIASLAGTIETLFVGWELVGLSSALLVSFFQERAGPVKNGLRVWIVYRISDAALLIASIAMHHLHGHGDFEKFLGQGAWETGAWPAGACDVRASAGMLVGVLMLIAAAAKSALVPFSGWLPRAMEGPTPSSAVFYGALSVHLGAFLLLRLGPLLDVMPGVRILVVLVGLTTAMFAAFTGRVQTDIKSALSFASLTQVGFIVAEIGFGLRYLALIHILGHACFRTLQFVRAPSLLYDFNTMENAIGNHLPRLGGSVENLIPRKLSLWAYRFALEKGYLDAFLADYCVKPFLKVMLFCDWLERGWTNFLAGESNQETTPSAASQEDTAV